MRYERPEIVDLGSIAAHTFAITQGQSQSHKGFDHPNGDFECELSSSPGSAPGPGLCGLPHPGDGNGNSGGGPPFGGPPGQNR